MNAISRTLGLVFRTVRRFARAASAEELLVGACTRTSVLDEFKPCLTRRWNQGCTNATQPHPEIRAEGWTGSLRAVQGYLRPFRGHQQVQVARSVAPSLRRLTGWIMTHPDRLRPHDQVRLKEVLARCPELETAADRVRDFATMMTSRQGHRLKEWITATTAVAPAPLASFAQGLRRDQAAVTAGLTLPHNSGAVEGAVTRIKLIKRQLYGRANLDLLRS